MSVVLMLSPYAGDIDKNIEYAQRAMMDCIKRGETPIAAHLLYTQILDDSDTYSRILGLNLATQLLPIADYVVVYIDHGISTGMENEINQLTIMGKKFVTREIENESKTNSN